jgi:hypothetical protein
LRDEGNTFRDIADAWVSEFRLSAIDTALTDDLYEKLLILRTTDAYRPKEHPNMVRIIDEKTNAESWIPLFDDAGVPLSCAMSCRSPRSAMAASPRAAMLS